MINSSVCVCWSVQQTGLRTGVENLPSQGRFFFLFSFFFSQGRFLNLMKDLYFLKISDVSRISWHRKVLRDGMLGNVAPSFVQLWEPNWRHCNIRVIAWIWLFIRAFKSSFIQSSFTESPLLTVCCAGVQSFSWRWGVDSGRLAQEEDVGVKLNVEH